MNNKNNLSNSAAFGIKLDKKWDAIQKYPHPIDDYWHQNDGPWPQPAPDNPVGQMAEIVHLPKQEAKDWKTYVGNMYLWRVLLQWPKGLWYAFTHNSYSDFSDEAFNSELAEGLYSKFLTPLDAGDLELFKKQLPDLEEDEALYLKADFSCMEPVAPHCYSGMFAAPSITLLKKDSSTTRGKRNHQVLAIYLYEVREKFGEVMNERILTAVDGEDWHLAKYFVLQGAVHRVNLTEHALLHFPYDPINAITKSILPRQHLLFQLLIPHLYLSLGVNKAVLENPGSLINRDKHKFYSPFCAEGIYIRKLLPDGYLGRKAKPNSYPEFDINRYPMFPPSQYGDFLSAYYQVFKDFVPQVLAKIDDDDEESWLYIALWIDCIEEWIPGFPHSEEIVNEGKPVNRDYLNKLVTLVMWDLSVAHATDHIEIHNKRPHGNPFRLRVPVPFSGHVAKGWRERLVTRWDLLTFWFTDLLFYLPNNVTSLKDVRYHFKLKDGQAQQQQELNELNEKFLRDLQACEAQLKKDGIRLASQLDEISTSLQY